MQRRRRLLFLMLKTHRRRCICRGLDCFDGRAGEWCYITKQPSEPDYSGDIFDHRLRLIKVDAFHAFTVNINTSVDVNHFFNKQKIHRRHL